MTDADQQAISVASHQMTTEQLIDCLKGYPPKSPICLRGSPDRDLFFPIEGVAIAASNSEAGAFRIVDPAKATEKAELIVVLTL